MLQLACLVISRLDQPSFNDEKLSKPITPRLSAEKYSDPQAPKPAGRANSRNRSKALVRSLPRCLVELPPKPDLKQNKKKPKPQAPRLAGGKDIISMSMPLEWGLPRLFKELPPKSTVLRNKLTFSKSRITIRVGRT